MSEETKKYPPDTPVTLEMLSDMLRKAAVNYKSPTAGWICEMVEEHIEPPKPEPKEGELWLVKPAELDYEYALWRFGNRWFYRSDRTSEAIQILTPIKRLIPQEDSDAS